MRTLQTPEGLSFFTQDVVYIVDRPFNLPELILEGLFGSSLYVWSPPEAPIQPVSSQGVALFMSVAAVSLTP